MYSQLRTAGIKPTSAGTRHSRLDRHIARSGRTNARLSVNRAATRCSRVLRMQARTSPRSRLRCWAPSKCLSVVFVRISREEDMLTFEFTHGKNGSMSREELSTLQVLTGLYIDKLSITIYYTGYAIMYIQQSSSTAAQLSLKPPGTDAGGRL
jgi:hypothetical protein